jgi:hypothetical protein
MTSYGKVMIILYKTERDHLTSGPNYYLSKTTEETTLKLSKGLLCPILKVEVRLSFGIEVSVGFTNLGW